MCVSNRFVSPNFCFVAHRIRGGDAASLSEGSLVHFEVLSCNHAHGVFFMDGGAPLATHRSS